MNVVSVVNVVNVDVEAFVERGYVVLRDVFDAAPFVFEVAAALADADVASFRARVASGDIHVEYVPMMCAQTPLSLALLDALEPVAVKLAGGPVLPTRAKGVRYRGSTPWHVDSARNMTSIGFAAYLEPLTETSGALRVLPGSHRDVHDHAAPHVDVRGVAVPTAPGDVIAFDEHLFHASSGGGVRLQWRADFVRDPGDDVESRELARAYYADIFPPTFTPAYDATRYPSYGPHWLHSGRACVARLAGLGVYELARGR